MKNIIPIILLLFTSFMIGYSQDSCNPPNNLNASPANSDVKLSWSPPVNNSFVLLSEQIILNTSQISDASPIHREIMKSIPNRDFMDAQFIFPMAIATGEAGAETDGSYIYTAKWNGEDFYQYNLDGTFIDTLQIVGVESVRDLAYATSTGYFYGANADSTIFIMDFNTQSLIGLLEAPTDVRAIAYNDDNDSFYANNWGADIVEFDRLSGAIISSFPVGTYSSYYGFAYDNWSDGGPFLWGFSQDGSGAELVQIQLPGGSETGLVIDVKPIVGGTEIAGGLFTQPDIVPGYVTIGGTLQNNLIFGLELSAIVQPQIYVFAGYNIYKNTILINANPYTDTVFLDSGLNPGTYQYEVTAIYNDTSGSFLCESTPAGPVDATILEQHLLGGNVFAGVQKLDDGKAFAYKIDGDNITYQSTADIDDFGYYFFYPFDESEYYVSISPATNSSFFNNYIPTYYGNVYHWENSQSINLQNNNYNADIHLIELSAFTAGPGRINGTVFKDNRNNITVSDILMLLLNNSNECIAKTYSNQQGWFSFDQLGVGTYKLLCEITGKKMTPQTIVLDNSNLYMDNMSLIIQQDEVVIGVDEQIADFVNFIGEIYPNPVKEDAFIKLNLNKSSELFISVFDISGKLLQTHKEFISSGTNIITIKTNYLQKGIYFARINFGSKLLINRKFVKF